MDIYSFTYGPNCTFVLKRKQFVSVSRTVVSNDLKKQLIKPRPPEISGVFNFPSKNPRGFYNFHIHTGQLDKSQMSLP